MLKVGSDLTYAFPLVHIAGSGTVGEAPLRAMSSSSLKKFLKGRIHKERAQPDSRKKYGLLEKHKDYVERARRYQRQREAIEVLQRKAADRNPDEFYFAMEHQRTKDGAVVRSEDEDNPKEEQLLELMQTSGYVNAMVQREAKVVEKLQSQLHFLGVPAKNRHTVFVDDEEAARRFSPEEYFDTPSDLLDRRFNRPRRSQLKSTAAVQGGREAEEVVKESEKSRVSKYRLLKKHIERHEKLKKLAAKMTLNKQLAADGSARKFKDDSGRIVYKWRQERKK
ncbi:unnamed protein product [Ostreobium quekettii]|uniref:U3 small nucleolar RNA-associated protein 11 n=1 Tax=Ostreobium quekettii TaxID=121088 RepID=A0A8S1IP70_9CHLO|nr:unnamed protein product [Ostreobium quekettii]|eukprot:evm.model.scf_280EXC.16 EVM.evm.TU.scf_280EXC.16   scf_280EXC:87636-92128(+)